MNRRTEMPYKAKLQGKEAQHDRSPRIVKYGKWYGCIREVRALIRGDLS